MIFETSRQARFMIPMALSLGYGTIFATIIVLILIACLFMIVDDVAALIHHNTGRGKTELQSRASCETAC